MVPRVFYHINIPRAFPPQLPEPSPVDSSLFYSSQFPRRQDERLPFSGHNLPHFIFPIANDDHWDHASRPYVLDLPPELHIKILLHLTSLDDFAATAAAHAVFRVHYNNIWTRGQVTAVVLERTIPGFHGALALQELMLLPAEERAKVWTDGHGMPFEGSGVRAVFNGVNKPDYMARIMHANAIVEKETATRYEETMLLEWGTRRERGDRVLDPHDHLRALSARAYSSTFRPVHGCATFTPSERARFAYIFYTYWRLYHCRSFTTKIRVLSRFSHWRVAAVYEMSKWMRDFLSAPRRYPLYYQVDPMCDVGVAAERELMWRACRKLGVCWNPPLRPKEAWWVKVSDRKMPAGYWTILGDGMEGLEALTEKLGPDVNANGSVGDEDGERGAEK
ncbi:MAG: hypothetical protein Q9159_001713 [Coniocarpon cinnabarinum]